MRLVGLNTALLSAKNGDHGKLRLGKAQLAAALERKDDDEFILVLSHHPFSGGWLADEVEADRWIRNGAHLHLFGHVKDAASQRARTGAGGDFLRIAARAAHRNADEPADHGYSVGAVIRREDESLAVRVWPRRWSDPNKDLRDDVDSVGDGIRYAEHPLRLRISRTPASVLDLSSARLPVGRLALLERDAEPAQLEKDPFHTAGTLPAGHPTYVVRPCDDALATALQREPLIAIVPVHAEMSASSCETSSMRSVETSVARSTTGGSWRGIREHRSR